MDRDNPEEQQEQKDQQNSTVDRVNNAIDRGRSVYNNAKNARSLLNKAKATRAGASGARTAATTARTTMTGVRAGVALFGSGAGEAIAIILLILLIIVIIISVLMLVAGSNPPASCEGIISDKASASVNSPVTLTLQNCTEGAIVSWTASRTGGTFSPADTTTTTYTPFSTSTTVTISITGKVCNPRAPTLCNEYTIDIIVLDSVDYTCPSVILHQYCSPEGCGGPDETYGTGTCPLGTRCCKETVSCADIDERLLADFGVKIMQVSESVSCTVKKRIYTIYSMPTQSDKYVSLLKPTKPITLQFYKGTYGTTSGKAPNPNTIMLTGFASFISNYSWFKMGAFLLIHETGHIIGQRNYSVKTAFPHSSLVNLDRSCYDRGYLKTYSLRCGSSCNITPKSESFAEAQGLYVYNSKNGKLADIDNFRVECDNTYSWIRTNVFGNTTIRILN